MDALSHKLSRLPLPWMAALAATALLVLGALQYRGSEHVSRALQERLGASLQSAAGRFARDFDRELTRVVLYFHPAPPFSDSSPEPEYAGRYRRWVETAPFPGLVRGVFLVRAGNSGTADVRKLDKQTELFVPGPCPEELSSLCGRLDALSARLREMQSPPPGPPHGPPPDRERTAIPLDPDAPAVLLPLVALRRGDWRRPSPEPSDPAYSVVVVWLDLETITRELCPEMAKRNFAHDDLAGYRLTVFRKGPQQRLIYDSRPSPGSLVPTTGDAEAELFRILPPPEFRSLELELGLHLWNGPEGHGPGNQGPESPGPGEPAPDGPRLERLAPEGQDMGGAGPPFGGPRRRVRDAGPAMRFAGGDNPGDWRVVVTHPDGSLQDVASRIRLHSLIVSLGTLALLGFSVVTILLSARRSQQLARQQLEFVAGVTHELLTPLAALRSAGQNLADGIVKDEARIRRYGSLIDGEGRRLSEMVAQVLDFAGMQARQGGSSFEPSAVRDLVEKALEGSGPLLAESGFQVEVDVPDDLPPVRADRTTLDRALRNLVANALKYAAAGRWLGIRAELARGRRGQEVRIRVEDRGPGIKAEDLPHVFEPFYRGRGLAASGLPGSGLGLALVRHIAEQHGGRVSVETAEGRGSAFTIHLPAAGNGRN